MKLDLSAAEAGLRPRACFDLGQRVTEVGAALAYADYFAKRLGSTGNQAVRDFSAGVYTAQLAAQRLKDGLDGKAKTRAAGFENEIRSLNDRVRKTWIEAGRPITVPETIEIQQKTSELRKKALEMWSEVRLACPDGGAGRRPDVRVRESKKTKRGRKAR